MHHYLTTYREGNARYAEAWLQVNLFGRCFCLWRVRKSCKDLDGTEPTPTAAWR